MATKKYLSLDRLTEYDALIKAEIDKKADSSHTHDYADSSHTHDDRYYTETEIDTKLSVVNTSITNITSGTTVVKEAEHATSADSATTATSATTASKLGSSTVGSVNQPIYLNSGTATKITAVGTAYGGTGATTVAGARTNLDVYSTTEVDTALSGKSDTSHNHDSAYDTKGAAATAEANAKTYADGIKNDLLNGAGTAYDTLKELGDLIDDNADAIDALETVAAGKANASHTHTVANITALTATATEFNYMDGVTSNVQTQLDAKQATITGAATTIASSNLTASRALISNGSGKVVVSAVTSTELGYLDGVTSAIQTQLDGKSDSSHTHSDATTSASGFMTAAMVTKLNGIATGANKTTVDSALSSTSANPVQNKVVNSAISTLTSTVSTNTSSISEHTTAISNLQTAVSEIQEITSAEIQALFA